MRLNSLTPKVPNSSTAIVCAETNISDKEMNVGFEWRKTDAPELVVSKSGAGVIYDGVLEGLIKNLDASSYYKVRPYYESAAGMRYYGGWIGFDPSDFSYFEPTVHTYAAVTVENGVATVSGYALAGSDDIEEQGFEYWQDGGASQTRMNAPAASADVQTVVATGQKMTAQLTGLVGGVTYKFRAYVKTSKGTTYGEDMEFKTPEVSGIESVTANGGAADVRVRARGGVVEVRVDGNGETGTALLSGINGQMAARGSVTFDGTWQPLGTAQAGGVYVVSVRGAGVARSVKVIIR